MEDYRTVTFAALHSARSATVMVEHKFSEANSHFLQIHKDSQETFSECPHEKHGSEKHKLTWQSKLSRSKFSQSLKIIPEVSLGEFRPIENYEPRSNHPVKQSIEGAIYVIEQYSPIKYPLG
jgi:hypothetical protein